MTPEATRILAPHKHEGERQMNKQVFLQLKARLKQEEGFRAEPYLDTTGNWTQGYGHKLPRKAVDHWSESWADAVLNNDIERTLTKLTKLDWFSELDDERQSVIVDMAFNLGVGGVLKFKKMIAAIQVQDWNEAAMQMLDSRWHSQVGERAERLAEMMRTGTAGSE